MTDQPNASEEHTSRLHNALALEDLVSANYESNKTMLSLVEHVRQETIAQDRKIQVLEKNTRQTTRLSYLLGATMLVLLVLAVFNAINIARTSQEARQLEDINRTLLDCVNSTGDCGRINSQNQKVILDEVKKYNLIGFYCIRTNPGTADPRGEGFLKCMDRLYPNGPTLEDR